MHVPLDNKVNATIIAEHIEWGIYSRNVRTYNSSYYDIRLDNKVNATTLNYGD